MAQALPNTPAVYQSLNNDRRPLGPDYRYTIRSIPVVDRTLTIHKDRYSIEKQLGKGGFGEVYSAQRLSDSKQVAIKIVSLATYDMGMANGLKQSFLTEVAMSKRLAKTSRHIVEMFDFDFHSNGLTFIVMELGLHDLEKALTAKPLAPPERKAVWRQLVKIAVTLRQHNIVHLDIKPLNLVVFPGNVVKLVDLGIAMKVGQTRVGNTGTRPYSAPEVITATISHQTINSPKADVWSWGAVLYRMTYNAMPDVYYTPPCHRPPGSKPETRDTHLRHLLRHTLVVNPAGRPDTNWLAQHPYTTGP